MYLSVKSVFRIRMFWTSIIEKIYIKENLYFYCLMTFLTFYLLRMMLMYLQKVISEGQIKRARSISQRYRSPDPYPNVTDPKHW
jgi:hypothetical protein